MAVDPDVVESYLKRPVPTRPDWKTMEWDQCQELIQARTGITFKRTKGPRLYRHQLRALAACIYLDHTLLYLGMRMGKTRIIMEYLEHMRVSYMWKGQAIIITTTPTVVHEAWMEQAPQYSNLKYLAVTSTKLDDMVRATESDADVIVTPWTSLVRIFGSKAKVKRRGKEAVNKFVIDQEVLDIFGEHFTFGCIDEIHACANPATARYTIGKALLDTPTVQFSAGLTGTPFGQLNPFEVWAQADIINHKLFNTNYYFFQTAYGKKRKTPFTRSGFEVVFDKTKLPQFQRVLASSSIAYKLSEVRVTDVRNEPVELKMTGEQLSEYNSTVDRVIERAKTKEITQTQMENVYMKLRRISAGTIPFVDQEGKQKFVHLPNHAKERWLNEAFDSGMFESPGVIFHDLTETGQYITTWLKKKKVKHSWLYGGTKGNARPVQDFMRGRVQWIVCNIASGAVGIDLSRADYWIGYEGNPSSKLRDQALARPLGPGRGKRPLFQIDLLASAVDRRILKLATSGMDMLDKVIYSPTSLERLLR